ncbi:MAG: YlmH/Sll1252 family protein [Lachnotalea sp.]
MLKKRLVELSNIAFNRNIPIFSDFLNLNELNIFYSLKNEFYTSVFKAYGGYELAERQMVAFIPDAFCCDIRELYPIKVVKISPLNKKFSDVLTHSDFLGAIINLGIDRSKVGDILVKDNEGFMFCNEKLADFLIEQLTRVKHTSVMAIATKLGEYKYEPEFKIIKGSIATARIDSVLTVCCATSRSEAVDYIMSKKVFINGRLIEANSEILKNNDVISVRGVGKFIYTGVLSETKKGRIYIEIKKYI